MSPRILALSLLFALPMACTPDYVIGDGDSPYVGSTDTGGISGRVCAPNESTWLAGATVWIQAGDRRIETTTDADGYYTLQDVPIGPWSVHVEKGSFSTEFVVEVTQGEVTIVEEQTCVSDAEINIAVVTGAFDSIEHVLDRLGIGYTLIDGEDGYSLNNFLTDPAAMEQYDILFFDCGMDESWIWLNETAVGNNLSDFVNNGGSLYASDWAYYTIESSFPNMIDFMGDDYDSEAAKIGVAGVVNATIRDPAMAAALGSNTATLNYDLDVWVAMQGVSDPSYTLVEGAFQTADWFNYTNEYGPLAAKMSVGDGRVLFTTFHNESQSTADMDTILQEIIFHL